MFSIIIPTHERHGVLMRAIDYYQNFNCNIFISDSSAKKLNYEFPDNIIYIHLPGLSFVKKILKVAESVKTQYVCMSADDDYLLESSLQAGERFLDCNLDYVSVQGRYLSFEVVENQVIFTPKYGQLASCYAVTNEDILARLVKAYDPYMHQFYSIHRTELLIKSIRSCVDITTCLMVELTTILVPMCYGKHKVLPILWMARDSYKFPRPNSYEVPFIDKSKPGTAISHYRSCNHYIKEVESFLNSEESQPVRKKFSMIISELMATDQEREEAFNVAFKSFEKYMISARNKIIIKIIIKKFVPAWVIKYYKTRQMARHMGGVEETASSQDAIDNIRLSVLKFLQCYK
jgi:glycosyltransferase domain-containing protein